MRRWAWLGVFFVCPAYGDISLECRCNSQPAIGLESYTIIAVGTEGEIINSFAGINITGVHNVTPPFGQPAVTSNQWAADNANGASLAEWKSFDTYFLFDPATDAAFTVGSFIETNDGTDPAGLNLSNMGLPATSGLGTFKHNLPTDQVTIVPSLASDRVPFLQVVQPSGTTTLINVVLFDNTGARAEFIGLPPDSSGCVPEPHSLALLGLAGIVLGCRRPT